MTLSTTVKQATLRYPNEDETYWTETYSGFKNSGLSRKTYCKTHDVNYERFGYWLSRQGKSKDLIAIKVNHLLSSEARRVLASIRLSEHQELLLHEVDALRAVLRGLD